jgi:hypothetical protein
VDLAATREVQNQPGTPAFGCTCKWCENWSRVWPSALPGELQEQLHRLRVDAAHPTDLYAFEEQNEGAHCRVVYHVVGKVVSGPNAWSEDPVNGRTLVYQMLREHPNSVGLVVLPSRQTFFARPLSGAVKGSELLQVDMRLYVPLLSTSRSASTEHLTREA